MVAGLLLCNQELFEINPVGIELVYVVDGTPVFGLSF
jgi:hypothetical protein